MNGADIPMERPPASSPGAGNGIPVAIVPNDERGVCGLIDPWDEIPRFFPSSRQVAELRGPEGLARPFGRACVRSDIECRIVIRPAAIEQPDGSCLSCFPDVAGKLVPPCSRGAAPRLTLSR